MQNEPNSGKGNKCIVDTLQDFFLVKSIKRKEPTLNTAYGVHVSITNEQTLCLSNNIGSLLINSVNCLLIHYKKLIRVGRLRIHTMFQKRPRNSGSYERGELADDSPRELLASCKVTADKS